MKWDLIEEEIVVKFYLRHVNDWRSNIDEVMKELRNAGFINRSESSTRMRISNVSSLHTCVGLYNASKQTRETYNRLKNYYN